MNFKNRIQVMKPFLGFKPGSTVQFPDIAKAIGLDFVKETDTVIEVSGALMQSGILCEVFPNCFVMETRIGEKPFLLVWTLMNPGPDEKPMYCSNIPGLEFRSFEELAIQSEVIGFYSDEEWPNNFKAIKSKHAVKPTARLAYGQSTPSESGQHTLLGYIYTGQDVFAVDHEYNVIQRKFEVRDFFDGSLEKYKALFPSQALASEFALYYTTPRRQRPQAKALEESKALKKTDVKKDKSLTLEEINKAWDDIPNLNDSPYAIQLRKYFMDNVLYNLV